MDSSNFATWVYRGITVILLTIVSYLGTNALNAVESLKISMETVLSALKYQQLDATKLEKRIENLELKIEDYNKRDHTFYKNK